MEAERSAQSGGIERYQSMLRLFDDVFFEYRRAEDSITFFNTGSSVLNEGSVPFSRQLERFRSGLSADAAEELQRFADSLQSGEASCSVLIPANLLYDDDEGSSTLLRGRTLTYADGSEVTVGLIRLQRLTDTRFDHTLNYDALTGVVTKEDITRLAINLIDDLHAGDTTIAIVDIDYFKHVNDTYGHMFGDLVLKSVADIMKREVGTFGTIGRIGGDEFFIIFHNVTETDSLREHLSNIRRLVIETFPDKGPQGDRPISLSIGSATYPRHADNFSDLFTIADYCLYLAKEKGRNRYIMYTPEKHATLEQIKAKKEAGIGGSVINGRDDLPLGDVLTQMQFLIHYGQRPELSALLREFAERFQIPLLLLYREQPRELLFSAGRQLEDGDTRADEIVRYLTPEDYASKRDHSGLIICNNIVHLPQELAETTEHLRARGAISFLLIPYTDAAGSNAVLAFLSLRQNLVWNQNHFMYYRLFTDLISLYALTEL